VDGSASGSENGTPSNPYHTIQAAVNAAANSDLIKVAKGTYSEAVQIWQKKIQLVGAILIINYDTTKLITLSHNIWRNNYAPSRGGAVFVDDGAKVKMEHELFYNNSSDASDGAALFVEASITHIQNSIFWNNGSDFEFYADGQAHAKLTVNYTLT
jgi:pectin methylesterase-like acyl-CoA thioesterase